MSHYLRYDYDSMSTEERAEAIERCKQAARDDAAADNGSAGGVEQMTIDARGFYYRQVEPAWHADEITDADCDAWQRELRENNDASDPRVAAYIAAWAEYQAEQPSPEHEVYLVLARTPNGTRYTRVVEDERHVDATDRVAVYGPYLLGGATGYPSEKELVDNVQVLEPDLDVDGWLAGTWGPDWVGCDHCYRSVAPEQIIKHDVGEDTEYWLCPKCDEEEQSELERTDEAPLDH
ncbi:MAG: hypothetical protein M0R06_14465 [Sphaerochaeta sp.]|nr:hypothetical protein [Sphaerochaeta sp.]